MALVRAKRYSLLEHIGRSIGGLRYSKESLFCMVTCYFDEAGGEDHGFIVVCGYVASVEQWQRFEYDWKILLARHDVPYLHMKELTHFKKSFKKWENKPGSRANFLRDAASIIDDYVQVGFSCYVAYDDYKRANGEYELSQLLSSPYAVASRACVAEANIWRRSNVAKLDMQYVFDDDPPDKEGLIRAMDVLTPRFPSPNFESSKDMRPCKKWPDGRKGVVQLQAADYLAYEMRKFISDHPKYRLGQRIPRRSLGALTHVDVKRIYVEHPKLVQLCKLAGLRRRKR